MRDNEDTLHSHPDIVTSLIVLEESVVLERISGLPVHLDGFGLLCILIIKYIEEIKV